MRTSSQLWSGVTSSPDRSVVRRTNSAAPSRPTRRLSSVATVRTESASSGVANAPPTLLATVVRRGRSSSSHASRNATAVTPAPTRKTSPSASVNAEMKLSRAAAGSSDTADGSSAPMSAGAEPRASRSSRRYVKIAPRIAVPSDPPIDRNSVAPDVATPSCSYGTAFCTASTSTCMTIPSPRPSTSHLERRPAWCSCPASIVLSASRPTEVTAVPAIGHAL